MTGKEYLEAFNMDEQASILIPCLWSLTQPSLKELRGLLMNASGSDLEDDFEEFVNVDVMTKAGLSFLGFRKQQECQRIFDSHSGDLPALLEKLAKECSLGGISKNRKEAYSSVAEELVPLQMLLAESAVYLLRSRNELKEWCRRFLRIVNEHPEPYNAIWDVLCNAMQGSLLIVNHYQSSHRTYDEAEKSFMSFMTNDRQESENMLWNVKRNRMVRALEGE